jgi:hypothetical protein
VRRWWIDVMMAGRSARVDVPRLVCVRVHGRDVARLDDVWAASHLGSRIERLAFDFVGEDGFCIMAKAGVAIPGRALATGYVCVTTRDLVWQPVPERPCYWRVKAVARMIALPAPP